MFSEMIAGLRQGVLPETGPLRGRCHAAITKKLAFVRLPPVYWETDSKRNPNTCHLLWAILLLRNKDMLDIIKGIILMEQAERQGLSLEAFMAQGQDGLLDLAPDAHFRRLLEKRLVSDGV